MPITEAPNDWNMNDSAFVENLGPSTTMMVPRSWKLQPCFFVTSIRICHKNNSTIFTFLTDWLSYGFTSESTQTRSCRHIETILQQISWLKQPTNTTTNKKIHKMLNLNNKMTAKSDKHAQIETAHICVFTTVHNCCAQHSTKQF